MSGFNDVWVAYIVLHNAFFALKRSNITVVDGDVRTQNTTKNPREKIKANTGLNHSLGMHLV